MRGKLVYPSARQAYGSSGNCQLISLTRVSNFFHGLAVTVACLKVHVRVDAGRIFLIGHSEGALIGTQLAGSNAPIAGRRSRTAPL